jgi:hypothetical protein
VAARELRNELHDGLVEALAVLGRGDDALSHLRRLLIGNDVVEHIKLTLLPSCRPALVRPWTFPA